MSVIKAHRNESNLEVLNQVDKLASELTKLMIRDFGIKDPAHVARVAYAIGKDSTESIDKYIFLIKDFKRILNHDVQLLGYYVKSADSSWPVTPEDYAFRRTQQDYAIGVCAHIRHELQRFCDEFDVSLADYRCVIFELDLEVELLKRWKTKDHTRFKKRIQRGNA